MKNFLGRHGMKYELEWIEQFILDRLLAYIRDNIELTDALVAKCGQDLDEEVERIKIRMRRDTIHLGDGHDAAAYVELYKEALMQLAGLRYAAQWHERNSLTPGMVMVIEFAFEALENLLLFLETSFAPFFDLDSRTPEVYLEAVSHEARLATDTLQNQLNAFACDAKLLNVVLLPFRQLANSRGQDTPYRKVSNLRFLRQELATILEQATAGTIDARLRTLLHSINFNYAEYFDYCTRDILQKLAGAEGSVQKQVGVLSEFKLYVEGILVRTKLVFDDYPPLRQSLLTWVGSRLEDIERSRPAVVRAPQKSADTLKLTVAEKILILMSSNEGAYFIQVLIRSGLIPEQYRSRLRVIFSANFLSKNGETLELENLRKKSNPDSTGVKKKVRAWLVKMIACIDADIVEGKK